MSRSPSELVTGLRATLGNRARIVTDLGDMAPFLTEPRKRFTQKAIAVVQPESVEALQALCRFADQNRMPLVPQSGNTGLVGGQVPLSGKEVVVNLGRLDKVRNINAGAGHMTLEAGVILEEAHRVAESAGVLFPLWIASQGSARIGGVLSSNAGGVQVLAYGNARELTLGVEAVLADGRLYNGLNALKKDNTGYDLKDLLVGAEGTLGFITAATLKLFPKPEGHETALVNVPSPAVALDLFYLLRDRLGRDLTAFELVPRFGFDLQLKHAMLARDPSASLSPWYVLCEVSRAKGDRKGALQSALETALILKLVPDVVLAESEADRVLMWAAREQMSDVQSREGASIKHDVSVPIAKVPALLEQGFAAVEKLVPGIRPCAFGHMGDGNIHFNLSQPEGADGKAFMAGAEKVHAAIYEIVVSLGGSVSAEHGIGQLKSTLLKQVKDPVALEMMRAIKAALDPKGILNPGKLLG
jgi:FAD/FMN-containing dehydrogenase